VATRKPRASDRAGRDSASVHSDGASVGRAAEPEAGPAWLSGQPSRWVIAVRAQPGARRAEVVGEHGRCLKIRIDAPPIEGRANEALLRWIAERLGLRHAQVTLLAGATGRDKRVLAETPLDRAQLVERLLTGQIA
jgi:uncharacterized protein (TIGR00251 family)